MHQGSPLLPIIRALSLNLHRHSLLPKAIFTASIQRNLGLPRTRPPLTSAINTLLAIRYSFILCMCPKPSQYSMIRSTHQLPFDTSSPTHLLIPNSISIRDTPTKFFKHLISTFTFLHSALLIPHASAPYNEVGTITPSCRHFLYRHLFYRHFFYLSPILYCSTHFSALPKLYTPHSFCVPHETMQIKK